VLYPNTAHRWLAVKTKPRAEKKVAALLTARGFSCHAITYQTLRQWSDRKKKVQLPLIPGVVFVAYNPQRLNDIYTVPLVHGILKEFGQPALVPPHEVDNLIILAQVWSGDAEDCRDNSDHWQEGDWVQVQYGPLKGLQGTLIGCKGQHRLVVQLEALQWQVSLEVAKSQVKRLKQQAA
jgi:transcription antitermination factor NusG